MKKKLVVLTGAGISAESGLQTFRDSDGLWMGYDIRDVATPEAFKKDPALVLDFYNMRRRNVLEAEPNEAHIALAKLEEHYNVTIITQNIDDLHERAGSSHVIHLHGSIFKMFSVGSPEKHVEIKGDINLGDMGDDGTQYRPQIVWFNEPVPLIETAASILEKSDIFILVGSSLQVYPAAGLIHYVPSEVPKYIVDKKIPDIHPFPNLFLIEEKATEGMRLLIEKLV
jgi:NAD-dependent deacetylase